MASLNLAGKNSGYVKLTAPDDSSTNPTVVLPTESGELALKSDIGSGGGGGDYTPEKLVWEDKTSERAVNTDYTNTNEVPLYIQLAIFTDGNVEDNYCEFIIDGTAVGASGIIGSKSWNNPLYIVPSGSTYRARIAGSTTVSMWHEARMPVAVGTGGKTVAFNSLFNNSLNITANNWVTVPFNEIIGDTDSGWNSSENVYEIKEAGYYQVNSTAQVNNLPLNSQVTSRVVRGGIAGEGALLFNDLGQTVITGSSSASSSGSYLIYCKKGATLSLQVNSTNDGVLFGDTNVRTSLSCFLVSGGSASGDSARVKALEARLDKLEAKLKK